MNDNYYRGIALLNSGEFYQAHEVLEDAWRESTGASKLFRQALVQIAVAMHHRSTCNFNGARSVLSRAIHNLAPFEQGFGGVDLYDLRRQLSACAEALDSNTPPPILQIRWVGAQDPSDE